MAKIYRFELAFLGEEQRIGFLQGLNDTGLFNAEARGLASMFDSLPSVDLDEPVSFWFTEEGIHEFESPINRVNMELSIYGWSLAGAFMDAPGCEKALFRKDEVIYEDRFQMALPKEAVDDLAAGGGVEYIEIFNVETFLKTTRNETMRGFQRKINELPFAPPASSIRALAGKIEKAYDGQGLLCGAESDALMYQLWLRNPEELERMGYDFADDA